MNVYISWSVPGGWVGGHVECQFDLIRYLGDIAIIPATSAQKYHYYYFLTEIGGSVYTLKGFNYRIVEELRIMVNQIISIC